VVPQVLGRWRTCSTAGDAAFLWEEDGDGREEGAGERVKAVHWERNTVHTSIFTTDREIDPMAKAVCRRPLLYGGTFTAAFSRWGGAPWGARVRVLGGVHVHKGVAPRTLSCRPS